MDKLLQVNRRAFMRGAVGALTSCAALRWGEALAHPEVGKVWGGWKPGEFQVHLIYTGLGESQLLILVDPLLPSKEKCGMTSGVGSRKVVWTCVRIRTSWLG